MNTKAKPSFLRLFMGGFLVGTAALVAVQAAHAESVRSPAPTAGFMTLAH